jgi:AraC-like DNA-binding protein
VSGVRVTVARSPGGARWTRVTRPVHPALAPLLHQAPVGFLQDGTPGERILEPAHPALTLMVGLRGGLVTDGVRLPPSWGAGLVDRHEHVEMPGRQSMIDVKLTPLGAYTILGRPLHELAGSIVALEDIFGPEGRRLHARLVDAERWEQRFDALEGFLLARAECGPRPTPLAARAVHCLRARGGDVRIGALARELGCSRRYLHARLREEVGVAPKTLARLLRFEAARRRLQGGAQRPAEVAADCGFYDEAHLFREFRALGGTTPTAAA